MTWIDSSEPGFWEHYPHDLLITDRLGRKLDLVRACNLLTGEVITMEPTLCQKLWHALLVPHWRGWRRAFFPAPYALHALSFGEEIASRHGFWPAPLNALLRGQAMAAMIRPGGRQRPPL
jgi:hypothetical protein